MLPSGDQLVSRLSGSSVSPVAPAPALPPGVSAGTGEADAAAPGLYGGYEAGFQAGQQAFERWAAAGGANRLMGESCIFKSMLAYGAGGVMGLAFGAFMAPFDSMNGLKVAENATAKETAMATIRQTRSKALSLGRTFAPIGGVYAMTECIIEKYRAKSDVRNAAYAGCLTGAYLGRSGGSLGACTGCAGFAVWSIAIEKIMHSEMMEGSSLAGRAD